MNIATLWCFLLIKDDVGMICQFNRAKVADTDSSDFVDLRCLEESVFLHTSRSLASRKKQFESIFS